VWLLSSVSSYLSHSICKITVGPHGFLFQN
jgi:hypothetical protein